MLVFSVFFIIPLFFMLYGSFVPTFTSTHYTLTYIIQAFTASRSVSVLFNTFEYGFGASFLSIGLATPYAWLVARTDVPGKRLFRTGGISRITIPLLGEAFAWIFLFSPTIGLINVGFDRLFGVTFTLFNIYSIWGLILAWGIGGIPFAFLALEPAFESVESSMEESSRVAGAGSIRTFATVTLRLVIPALLSVFLLVALGGLENFDYPLIIGSQAHIVTLATQVYNLVGLNEYPLAAAYGIYFLLVTVVILAVYLWVTRRSYRFAVVKGNVSRHTLVKLGRWKWVSFAFLSFVFFISLVLPVVTLVLVSLVRNYTVSGGANPFATLTLQNYIDALSLPVFQQATINSIVLSVLSGFFATILGAMMSYVLIKGRERGKNVLYFISHLPLAFPGVVYSVALIWTFLILPFFNTYIYGTIWVMLIGLIIIWLPYSIRIISPILIQISDELEESAAVMGSSWTGSFRRVTLPLLRSSLLNSFIYVMLDSFRELGAIVLLYNASSILLIIAVLNLYNEGGAPLSVVSALLTVMIAISAVFLVISRVLGRSNFEKYSAG
jgi:iron(III) transport system permease protein